MPDESAAGNGNGGERFLIVGLGNPGPRYDATPHNLGFLVIDRLAEVHGIRVTQPDSKALVGPGMVEGVPALLAKPQTFMNLSGTSVKPLMEKYSIAAERVLLVYDELSLPWGTLRIRPGGSSAGHKGAESVIAYAGTIAVPRVRIGIHPGHPVRDGAAYVLSQFSREQKKDLDAVLDLACRAVESIIAEGVEKAMTRFNRRAQGTKEEE